MDAKQARKAAQKNLEVLNSEELKSIERSILSSVLAGRMHTDVYVSLSKITEKYLQEKGYCVEYKEEGRQDFYHRISW